MDFTGRGLPPIFTSWSSVPVIIEPFSQDAALPNPLVACVPSTEFSEAYPKVYKEYEEMLEAKAAAKKKPKKKKDKENVAPKETKAKAKKNVKKQPTMDAFIRKEIPKEVEYERPLSWWSKQVSIE